MFNNKKNNEKNNIDANSFNVENIKENTKKEKTVMEQKETEAKNAELLNDSKSEVIKEFRDAASVNKSERNTWLLDAQDFGPLLKYMADDEITDIDWDSDSFWIRRAGHIRERVFDDEITAGFMSNFAYKVSNHESAPFNQENCSFTAETETLRITCTNEPLAISGLSVCIRKSFPSLRFTPAQALSNKYCEEKVMHLLVNCVQADFNMIFCGYPGCGKTEAVKFFSSFIQDYKKVITVEDSRELHYKKINPEKSAIEFKVKTQEAYLDSIEVALRMNPSWLMIAEARSREVVFLKEGMSTGIKLMSTIHTDDARNIVYRMIDMMGYVTDKRHEINNLYNLLDVGVHIVEVNDKDGCTHREIEQICFFERDEGHDKNRAIVVLEKGVLYPERIPESVKEKILCNPDIDDVFCNKELASRIEEKENDRNYE